MVGILTSASSMQETAVETGILIRAIIPQPKSQSAKVMYAHYLMGSYPPLQVVMLKALQK